MFKYAVVELSGRQYLIEPKKTFEVDFLGDKKTLECEKVLLISDDKGLNLGNPYLKQRLVFDVLETNKSKIRVATYKAKANTRKAKGQVRTVSKIRLQDKQS
ncbi:50S ribosomal protein L21 [Candidatus Daviesbacteria bacterium]|nr:50S ribosomal protein L21 [Candidatus Daviesbacteria bacterium]